MNQQQISGILISAGFLFYFAAMIAAPRLYNTTDIAQRMTIIGAEQVRWNLSQFLFALGPGSTALGFLLLALSQRATPSGWLYGLAAGLIAVGTGIAIWLVYRQTMDPAAFWEGKETPLIISYGFLLPTLVGMVCAGIAMLLGEFPKWTGDAMVGSGAVLMAVALATKGKGGFFISIFIYLATFIVGIALWRM